MTDATWNALAVSLKIASLSTSFGFLPACALGYLLATKNFRGKALISAVSTLPLVLPPTAVGYLLLRLLAFDGPLGKRSLGFDPGMLMTYRGAVVATAIMSFPLMVRTARVAFEGVPHRVFQVAATLGHRPVWVFFGFALPICRRGLLASAILGFSRALGEFGASATVAGNIEGQTSTLATAIWGAQEMGARGEANRLILIAVVIGLSAALSSEYLATTKTNGRRNGPDETRREQDLAQIAEVQ